MSNSNLELLSFVHSVQAKNKLCADQLNAKVAAAPDSTHIEIRTEAAANLAFLLETQSKILTAVLEENQIIHDQLEKFVETLT